MRITTPEQRARLADAERALRAATRAYERAEKAVKDTREALYRAIFEADLAGMRQVDITAATKTTTRPRGFTREHVRRVVDEIALAEDGAATEGDAVSTEPAEHAVA